MKDLRPNRIQRPIKLNLDILHEMTRQLHMSHIRRMILRANIIMGQYARRIEIMHKRLTWCFWFVSCVFGVVVENGLLEVFGGVEVFVDGVDLGDESDVGGQGWLDVGVSYGVETFPETLGFWLGRVMMGEGNLRSGWFVLLAIGHEHLRLTLCTEQHIQPSSRCWLHCCHSYQYW